MLFDPDIPKLDDYQKLMCDKQISVEECFKTLGTFKDKKTPGNDGLSKEFYVKFWQKVRNPLIDCYKYSFTHDSMSTSQKQAVITLIEKKGKDRAFLNNWRPISLLNFDYKLSTKLLSNRVKEVLPSIISETQTGYVKNRNIEDSMRIIQDIIHHSNSNNVPGILLAVEFRKAFDTVEWSFLFRTLKHFNFGANVIQWVKTFYNGINSCIINNGKSSNYFDIGRGVRQGDPLSPYLFIIVVELLAKAIKRNRNISGITINSYEFKMTQYADDLTLTLGKPEAIPYILELLDNFGKCSGLQINREKTEGILLGSLKDNTNISSQIKITKNPIKILGIYVSNNLHDAIIKNIQEKKESLIKQLHWWKARDLSLQGRILIIKSLALPKFQFLALLLPIPKNIVVEINTLLYKYVWKGKTDKVKRVILEQTYDKGGLKMVNMHHMVNSVSVIWIKRYLDDVDRLWKRTFEHFCNCKNLNMFLRSNPDISCLPVTVPEYYRTSIRNWLEISYQTSSKKIDENMFLWYNKEFRIGDKCLYNDTLFRAGLWSVVDLCKDNTVVPFEVWKERGAEEKDRMLWMGLIKIFNHNFKKVGIVEKGIKCGILVDGKFVSMQKVTQKVIKLHVVSKEYLDLQEKDKKYKHKADNNFGPIDKSEWKEVFEMPQILPIDNKGREVQYKILMRFFPTNSLLYHMNKVTSHQCTFCMLEKETIEHLFYHCISVRNILLYILNEWKKITGATITLTLKEMILGRLCV